MNQFYSFATWMRKFFLVTSPILLFIFFIIFILFWEKNASINAKITAEQNLIHSKTYLYVKLNSEMWAVRITNENIRLDCQLHHYDPAYDYNPEKNALSRLYIRGNFIKTVISSEGVFNKSLRDQIYIFSNFDKSIVNLCASDAPKDIAWREKQLKVQSIINKSIERDKEKLHVLQGEK